MGRLYSLTRAYIHDNSNHTDEAPAHPGRSQLGGFYWVRASIRCVISRFRLVRSRDASGSYLDSLKFRALLCESFHGRHPFVGSGGLLGSGGVQVDIERGQPATDRRVEICFGTAGFRLCGLAKLNPKLDIKSGILVTSVSGAKLRLITVSQPPLSRTSPLMLHSNLRDTHVLTLTLFINKSF